ncbi:Kinesin-14 [Giardia muris]|uniref:Kinesin-14 n=1 Tax=Giardia muris TaxID=5742 RepID=A0A4Z1SXS1_GIAMU|nr:Kinesin-14 [Giardia muris]|eukprot:TNJ26483.1 Kinesin-14 [Giardia muris]
MDRFSFSVLHLAERRKFLVTAKRQDIPVLRVRTLKRAIARATGIPAENQCLFLKGRLLRDSTTGDEIDLSTETVFTLQLQPTREHNDSAAPDVDTNYTIANADADFLRLSSVDTQLSNPHIARAKAYAEPDRLSDTVAYNVHRDPRTAQSNFRGGIGESSDDYLSAAALAATQGIPEGRGSRLGNGSRYRTHMDESRVHGAGQPALQGSSILGTTVGHGNPERISTIAIGSLPSSMCETLAGNDGEQTSSDDPDTPSVILGTRRGPRKLHLSQSQSGTKPAKSSPLGIGHVAPQTSSETSELRTTSPLTIRPPERLLEVSAIDKGKEKEKEREKSRVVGKSLLTTSALETVAMPSSEHEAHSLRTDEQGMGSVDISNRQMHRTQRQQQEAITHMEQQIRDLQSQLGAMQATIREVKEREKEPSVTERSSLGTDTSAVELAEFREYYEVCLRGLREEIEALKVAPKPVQSGSPQYNESLLEPKAATPPEVGTSGAPNIRRSSVLDDSRRWSGSRLGRSQLSAGMVTTMTLQQQVSEEQEALSRLIQQEELHLIIGSFLETELQIADLEERSLNKTIQDARAGLEDAQTRLADALRRTPTFTQEVRASVEMSQVYGALLQERERLQTALYAENRLRRHLHNTLEDLKGNIRVIVRLRPMLRHEQDALAGPRFGNFDYHEAFIFKDEHTLQLNLPPGVAAQSRYQFEFYRALSDTRTQEEVFQDMSHLLKSVIDGYNVCVLAYGCTGSGKTFTLIGDDADADTATPEELSARNPYDRLGLLPRSIVELYNLIEAETVGGQRFEVRCAMLELYLDQILDLLHTDDGPNTQTPNFNSTKLSVRQSAKGSTYVQNLSYKPVQDAEELVGYLGYGLERRHIASTRLNSYSSRSHTVFFIEVHSHKPAGPGGESRTTRSVLTFADLAGSENVSKSQSNGLRFKEAQHINSSLCALGDVIAALSRRTPTGHVPYRNNKLTMILQPSLGHKAKTLLYANISPLPTMLFETLSTLNFASRVRSVRNVPVKNVLGTGK